MSKTIKYKSYKNFSDALESFKKNNQLLHWWADRDFYYIQYREVY